MIIILSGYNKDLNYQQELLKKIIMSNDKLNEVITKAHLLELDQFYIGAGSIVQTVWNYLSSYPLDKGINDIDVVYFNKIDSSYEEENEIIEKAKQLFKDVPIQLDIKNQARVHLWYEAHFGYSIEPYDSVESAINTWPTTATAIGVRMDNNGEWSIYAPYGLNDLFGLIVRPNKVQITKEIYEKKVKRWTSIWNDLKVIPW